MIEVLVFLAHVPDRGRAEAVGAGVGECLTRAACCQADPTDPGYGLTPRHMAPAPDSPWRQLFDVGIIDGHLDRLARDQQADGGWPVTWEAPGIVSGME